MGSGFTSSYNYLKKDQESYYIIETLTRYVRNEAENDCIKINESFNLFKEEFKKIFRSKHTKN